VIFVALDHAHTVPAPIDAVALNEPLLVQLHRLDEVHLIAVRGLARILPDQALAVGQIAGAVELARRRLARGDLVQQLLDLSAAADDTPLGLQDMRNERAFDHGIRRIERQQRLLVVARQRVIPREIDLLHRRGCGGRNTGFGQLLVHRVLQGPLGRSMRPCNANHTSIEAFRPERPGRFEPGRSMIVSGARAVRGFSPFPAPAASPGHRARHHVRGAVAARPASRARPAPAPLRSTSPSLRPAGP
jgi:hypothetical protein